MQLPRRLPQLLPTQLPSQFRTRSRTAVLNSRDSKSEERSLRDQHCVCASAWRPQLNPNSTPLPSSPPALQDMMTAATPAAGVASAAARDAAPAPATPAGAGAAVPRPPPPPVPAVPAPAVPADAAAGDGYPGPDRYPGFDHYMHAGFAEPYGAGFERPANRPQRNAVPVRPEHMDRTELCRYEFGMFSAEASRCNVGAGRSRQL